METNAPPSSAVVVGGGISGLWVARALARRGVATTVVDRSEPGAGTSVGSAGWISPVQSGPLPQPGQIGFALRSLFDRDSALHVSPLYAPRIVPWLAAFARRCNRRDFEAGVRALARLSYPSFDLVDELEQTHPQVATLRTGLVLAARSRASVQRHLDALAPLRELGHAIPEEPSSPDRIGDVEPFVAGRGLWGAALADHWAVTPRNLTDALVDELTALGVTIAVEEGGVTGLERAGGRIRAVRTPSGELEADAVVLAAGVWSGALARSVGVGLPLLGGKGYSVELDVPSPPSRSVLLVDDHVAFTPLGDRLRVAGTMEFSGDGLGVDPRRVRAMLRAASALTDGAEPAGEPWCGLRPLLPDGLPAVGRTHGVDDLYVASGYGMLGLTVSPMAGVLLADEIVEGRPQADLLPFSPARFGRARRP